MSEIEFKTINGQLCRMVERTPLCPDSQFPCVVRLIQDDSPMGLYNQDLYKSALHVTEMCVGINVNQDVKTVVLSIPGSSLHYAKYEIIGYPVVEGSKEWALQMMKLGMSLCNIEIPAARYCLDNGKVIEYAIEGNKQTGYMSFDGWVETAKKTGWQIYSEPDPQPVDSGRWVCFECGVKDSRKGHFPGCSRDVKPKSTYKVGDWVETNKQHHVKITEFPAKHYKTESKVYECYNLSSNKQHLIVERDIVRKLDPSEVHVKITLEGQVTKPLDNAGGRFWLYYSTDEYVSIELDALFPKDRELVEALLKAQEESCHS